MRSKIRAAALLGGRCWRRAVPRLVAAMNRPSNSLGELVCAHEHAPIMLPDRASLQFREFAVASFSAVRHGDGSLNGRAGALKQMLLLDERRQTMLLDAYVAFSKVIYDIAFDNAEARRCLSFADRDFNELCSGSRRPWSAFVPPKKHSTPKSKKLTAGHSSTSRLVSHGVTLQRLRQPPNGETDGAPGLMARGTRRCQKKAPDFCGAKSFLLRWRESSARKKLYLCCD